MGTHYHGDEDVRRALDAYIKLMRAAETIKSRLGRALAEHGLTMSQLGVLETLLHLGPMCQRDIGRKLLVSGGNVTTVVDNLQKRSLVRRQRGEQDRRFVTVHLTDEGRGLIEGVFPQHAREIRRLMSGLSLEELDQLGDLCRSLGRTAAEVDTEE
ncbi:MAG: MarR family winged helix-turn-helix transcriptional regulator [Myxococcota bacterium]